MLTTYWDLSENERAALTREEVERFIDAELMTKGVLKVPALVVEPEPEVTLEKRTVYRVRSSRFSKTEFAFDTQAKAEAVLAMRPMVIDTEWMEGRNVEFVKPLAEDSGVELDSVATQASVIEQKSALKRQQAVKAENARRIEEHEKATKAIEGVLAGLWEDWYGCQATRDRHARVIRTLDEYTVTAGGDGRSQAHVNDTPRIAPKSPTAARMPSRSSGDIRRTPCAASANWRSV